MFLSNLYGFWVQFVVQDIFDEFYDIWVPCITCRYYIAYFAADEPPICNYDASLHFWRCHQWLLLSLTHLTLFCHGFYSIFIWLFLSILHRQGWQESCRGSETKVWGREAIQGGFNAGDVHPDEREGAGKIHYKVGSNSTVFSVHFFAIIKYTWSNDRRYFACLFVVLWPSTLLHKLMNL